MRHLAALLLLIGPLAGAAFAQTAPRSIGDCEKIKGDLAYNQCLAMFGPKANTKAASADGLPGAAPPADSTATAAAAEPAPTRGYGRRSRSGRVAYSRGRQRAAFAVGSTQRSYRRSRRR